MLKNPKYVYGGHDHTIPANLNFGAFMLDSLWKNRDKVVLTNGSTNETLTSGDIAQEAMNLAISLTRMGLGKGDVVALCSENRREFWGTVIGTACTGATVTTINPGYSKDEFIHALSISKPALLFCSLKAYEAFGKTMKSYNFTKIILYADKRLEDTILYDDFVRAKDGGKLAENIKYEDFLAVEVQGQKDTLFILYSSGTTGVAKGVMVTHLNLLALSCLESTVDPDKTHLTITPWFHSMGLIGTLRSLAKGAETVYLPKFEIETYLKAIERYKINQLVVVPPILVALCKYQSNHNVSSVNLVYSGAAPLHSDTVNDVLKRFPNIQAVLQGYGMTETTLGIIINPYNLAHLSKNGGVGFIVKNTVIKIVDIETRKPLGPYEPGEICVQGVLVMKGYIGKDKQDDFDEEGFFKTGDVGYYDENKYFFIVDRLKELIKCKGYQVAPMELEAVLLKHPGVRDAGVVGLPHATFGEVPLAFVVPQPGVNPAEIELQQFVAERLSNPKHLRGGVRFVAEIPKNPSGKILRKHLRAMVKNSKL